jgi:D-alanyl-D-alanine endopeptidase (penicillin-binding protein 7)
MYKLALSALISLMFASAAVTATAATDADAAPKKHQTKKSKVRQPLRVAAADTGERVIKRVIKVNGRRKVVYQRMMVAAPAVPTMGDLAGLNLTRDPLDLKSNVALVLDQDNSEVLFEKNAGVALPIASITKMMTGLVVVEAKQDMDEVLTVTDDDVDRAKFSSSRLKVGAQLTRATCCTSP